MVKCIIIARPINVFYTFFWYKISCNSSVIISFYVLDKRICSFTDFHWDVRKRKLLLVSNISLVSRTQVLMPAAVALQRTVVHMDFRKLFQRPERPLLYKTDGELWNVYCHQLHKDDRDHSANKDNRKCTLTKRSTHSVVAGYLGQIWIIKLFLGEQ